MTEKRFTIRKSMYIADDYVVIDNEREYTFSTLSKSKAINYCRILNLLNDENKELKEVIEEVFERVTDIDYVRKQYLNGLLNVLGEENDVEKTKKRVKECLE